MYSSTCWGVRSRRSVYIGRVMNVKRQRDMMLIIKSKGWIGWMLPCWISCSIVSQ